MSGTNIRVVCRLRPLNNLELSKGGQICVSFTDKAIKVKEGGEEGQAESNHDFAFDRIFGPEISQKGIFQEVAIPVIENVFKGFNGTIFAYGQTSSGKTFTMEGPSLDNDELKGLIPRMFDKMFEMIVKADEHIEFTVKCSFLEIYNEKIQDLLDPRKNNLAIKEDKIKGIYVAEATEVYVNSPDQMKAVMRTGSENRSVAATKMNERSSRSHSIFILYLMQKDTKTDAKKQSKLYFVDLAGSEKVGKTGASGTTLDEAKKINQSLTTLGMVINSLTSDQKNAHVPFRDSKLTRILQESLGGNSTTTLLIACSMCSYNDKETISTLRFGARAKNIKNKPIVNVERSVKELEILLEDAEKRIKKQEQIISLLKMKIDNPNAAGVDLSVLDTPSKEAPLTARAAEANPEDEEAKKEEVVEQPPMTQRTLSRQDTAGAGKASMNMLKQHIQITQMQEELNKLKADKRDLEAELQTRTNEVFELQERGSLMEEHWKSMFLKQNSYLHQFQIYYEKGLLANQELLHNMQKMRRDFSKLKSDLMVLSSSEDIKNGLANANDIPPDSEELATNSIKKVINEIDRLDAFLNEQSNTSFEKVNLGLADDLLKAHQQALMQAATPSNTTEATTPRTSSKTMRQTRSARTTLQGEKSEALSIETDDVRSNEDSDRFLTSAGVRGKEKDALDQIDKEIMEEDSEIVMETILSGNITDEEKIAELQKLVATQRRSILNLNKSYLDLNAQYDKLSANTEKKMLEYKKQLTAMNSNMSLNVKDFETKMAPLETLNQNLLNENTSLRQGSEALKNELNSKDQIISQLKSQLQKLQNPTGSPVADRTSPISPKAEGNPDSKEPSEVKAHYQKEVLKLRRELEEKDEALDDKEAQVQMMKVNIDVLTQKLEMMEKLKETRAEILKGSALSGDSASKSRSVNDKGTINNQLRKMLVDKKKQAATKESLAFFDKNVIKPIRGGGGDVKNFERANFLVDEESKGEFNDFMKDNKEKTEAKGDATGYTPRMEVVKQLYSTIQANQDENPLATNDDVVSESFRNDFGKMIYDENIQAVEKKFMDLGKRNTKSKKAPETPTTTNTVQSFFKKFFQ